VIKIYNRYVGNIPGRYARRIPYSPPPPKAENVKQTPREEKPAPPCPSPEEKHFSFPFQGKSLTGLFKTILPDWLDAGDLVLLLLMLFLYIESEDEDFLIILLVVGFSVFKKP